MGLYIGCMEHTVRRLLDAVMLSVLGLDSPITEVNEDDVETK